MFLVIRLFAIYDKRRWILYVTVPFGLLNIVLSSYAIVSASAGTSGALVSEKGAGVTFSSCFTQPSFNNESPLLFKLSYVAIILFDTFIFVLAAARTGWMYRAKQLRRSHSSIVSILLRDGTMLYA